MNVYHHSAAVLVCMNTDGTFCTGYGGSAAGVRLNLRGSGGVAVSDAYVALGPGLCDAGGGGLAHAGGSSYQSLQECKDLCDQNSNCRHVFHAEAKASDNCWHNSRTSCYNSNGELKVPLSSDNSATKYYFEGYAKNNQLNLAQPDLPLFLVRRQYLMPMISTTNSAYQCPK